MEDSAELFKTNKNLEDLKARLKNIKKKLAHISLIEDSIPYMHVPIDVREELLNIYEEHGGLELLSQFTKIPFNNLKHWFKKWRYNPGYFRREGLLSVLPKGHLKSSVVRKALEHTTPIRKEIKAVTSESKPGQVALESLTNAEQNLVMRVKLLIKTKMVQGGTLDDPEIKDEVKLLCKALESPTTVATLLGLNEKLVSSWGSS